MPRGTSARELFDPEAVGNGDFAEPPFFRRLQISPDSPPYTPSVAQVAHLANRAVHPPPWKGQGSQGPGGEIWKVDDLAFVANERRDYRQDVGLTKIGVKAMVQLKTAAGLMNLIAKQGHSTATAARIAAIRGQEARVAAASLVNHTGRPLLVSRSNSPDEGGGGGLGGLLGSFLEVDGDKQLSISGEHSQCSAAQGSSMPRPGKRRTPTSFMIMDVIMGVFGLGAGSGGSDGTGEIPAYSPSSPEMEAYWRMRDLEDALHSTQRVARQSREFASLVRSGADYANQAVAAAENLMGLPGAPPGATPMVTFQRPPLPRRPRDLAPAWLDLPYSLPPGGGMLKDPYEAQRDPLPAHYGDPPPPVREPKSLPLDELLRLRRFAGPGEAEGVHSMPDDMTTPKGLAVMS